MLDIICLWIGRIVLFIVGLILLLILLSIILKGISVLLRKPYYCIKRLLPWRWLTEEGYNEIVKVKNENPRFSNVKVIRKGNFGNLYIPNKVNWWDSKNHYFIIKKS